MSLSVHTLVNKTIFLYIIVGAEWQPNLEYFNKISRLFQYLNCDIYFIRKFYYEMRLLIHTSLDAGYRVLLLLSLRNIQRVKREFIFKLYLKMKEVIVTENIIVIILLCHLSWDSPTITVSVILSLINATEDMHIYTLNIYNKLCGTICSI